MSKNTAAVHILLLQLRVTLSVGLMHCSVVLRRARKPNWLVLTRLLSSMCFWTIFRTTFSNSLPVINRKLIGRKFWGNFWPLPGFGNVMILSSFQEFGKWDSQRQWLNKCVKCTNGCLGRYLRHSFRMPSILQAFLNFKELINICKSLSIPSGGLLSMASSSQSVKNLVSGVPYDRVVVTSS
jgi:hypothetical protein